VETLGSGIAIESGVVLESRSDIENGGVLESWNARC